MDSQTPKKVSSRKMRLILPTLATVLVVASIAAVLVVRSRSTTANPTASWTTFRDPLGLYTIKYPAGWKVTGGVSTSGGLTLPATYGGDTIPFAGTSDGYFLTENANPNMTLLISALKFINSDERAYWCRPNTEFTSSGLPPATAPGIGGFYLFNTGNAHFQIDVGPSPSMVGSLQGIPPHPTQVSSPTASQQAALYNSILSTFKSLAPKGSSC